MIDKWLVKPKDEKIIQFVEWISKEEQKLNANY